MKPATLLKPAFKALQSKTVGVVCGGFSAERRISLRSGRAVCKALRRSGVRSFLIDPANRSEFWKRLRKADILFLALHGRGGEDGLFQQWLEQRGLLFTASDSHACRNSFDKLVTKRHLERLKIPTPEYQILTKQNWRTLAARFPAPFFIKPLDGGSSQGVFLVEDFRKSAEKIKRSVLRLGALLIEKKISGRELTAGILVDRKLPVIEVRPKRMFYDYKAKYTKGMTEYIVPAKIPAGVAKRVQNLAWRLYKGIGLAGFARVDVMLDEKKRPYVLEVNSIPGMTELSLLPKAAQAVGIGFEELCLRVLIDALDRREKGL